MFLAPEVFTLLFMHLATGPRGCKVSFVGCVAGGVSAAVLLLLGVLVIVVFTLFNLRDNQRHASPSHDHPKKGIIQLH